MRGFKVLTLGLAAVVAISFAACDDQPTEPEQQAAQFKPDKLGNGYPATQFDYKLNIIGVPQGKTADMDNNNGRRIFVMLNGGEEVDNPGGKQGNAFKNNQVNRIYLCNSTDGLNDSTDPRCEDWRTTNGGDFGVIDANATDDDGALFALPDPCTDDNLASTACSPTYGIWARVKAGSGYAIMTTCAEEDFTNDTNEIWCGSNQLTLDKQTYRKAKPVSDSLLYMTITVDGTVDTGLATCLGTSTTGSEEIDVYLFDNCFENYFWNYDNHGLKNVELRFYSN